MPDLLCYHLVCVLKGILVGPVCGWGQLVGGVNMFILLLRTEAAFFDPSILALLYFPDDQK